MNRWDDRESTSSGMFLLGAVAGAMVGAGVALLMAPKSGAEVRQDLSEGYNSMRDSASKRYRDLAERANAKLGDLERQVNQYASRGTSTSTSTSSSPSNGESPMGGFPQA